MPQVPQGGACFEIIKPHRSAKPLGIVFRSLKRFPRAGSILRLDVRSKLTDLAENLMGPMYAGRITNSGLPV